MSRKIRVMVVDDDSVLRRLVSDQIARMGFDSTPARPARRRSKRSPKATSTWCSSTSGCPASRGLDTLREVRKLEDAPEVIMLTADTSLGTGIEAMRLGAYDYLTKPATLDEIEAVIRKADEKRRLVRQNASLRDAVPRSRRRSAHGALVYKSKAMEGLVALAETAARADSTVVITGESGTGKDVLARFIHARSQRADSPMIAVNCAALPETLFESEFFGHERGAFTGATSTKRGLIEAADSSTLFLDEVGEMPAQTQVKLLRFLEEGRFRRVGSTRDRDADVRVIAATNRNLAEDVHRRALPRRPLLPPQRHLAPRPAAAPPARRHPRARRALPLALPRALQAPRARPLTGSARAPRRLRLARQRARAAQHARTRRRSRRLRLRHHRGRPAPPAPPRPSSAADDTPGTLDPRPCTLDQLERQHILRVLEEQSGNRERAAAVLGISARTLYRKLREYGD